MESKAQRAYLHMHHPRVAKQFEEETPDSERLPEHVRKMNHGGMACMHCGGEVDGEGYAVGYSEPMDDGDSDDSTTPQDHEAERYYAKAVKRKSGG